MATQIEFFEISGGSISLVTKGSNGIRHEKSIDLKNQIQPLLKKAATSRKQANDQAATRLANFIAKALPEQHADDTAVPIRFYRGKWSPDKTFYPGDIFSYGSMMMIATKETRGISPDSMFGNGAQTAGYVTMGGGGGGSSQSGGGGGFPDPQYIASYIDAMNQSAADKIVTASALRDYVRQYQTLIGDGTTKVFDIVHSLNEPYPLLQAINTTTKSISVVNYTIIDNNTVRLTFTTAPTVNKFKIIITG